MTFQPPPREPDKDHSHDKSDVPNPKTVFDAYIDGMRVKLLKRAYVLLVPTSDAQQSVAPDSSNLIFCRTADDGELLQIDEGSIDGDVPSSQCANWKLFSPDSTFMYFWTLSCERFKLVIRNVRKDLHTALAVNDFSSFSVSREPVGDADREELFELIHERSDFWMIDAVLRRALTASSTWTSAPGYFQGYDLKTVNSLWNTDLHRYHRYLFARRKVADLLYCAELTQCHAVGLRQRSARQFAVFALADDIYDKAESGKMDPALEELSKHQQFREEYFQYAYECARNLNVNRKLFSRAVDVSSTRDDWMEAAVQIAKDYGIISPCIDLSREDPRWRYKFINTSVAMRYFDFYRFGSERLLVSTARYCRTSLDHITQNLERVRAQLARLMAHVGYYEVLVCMANYPDENTLDVHIHCRFLDLSIDVYHPWWETFDPEDKSVWELNKPYVEQIGSFLDKVSGVYAEQFENYEHIEKYNHMLQNSAAQAKKLINRMVKWNDLIGGKTVVLKDAATPFRVTTDLEKGTVSVYKGSQKVADMQLLLKRVMPAVAISDEQRASFGFYSFGARVRIREAKMPVNFEVRPPFREIRAWPAWLGVIGQVLSAVVSVSELVEKIENQESTAHEKVVAVAAVAKDAFQLIDGFGAALHATLPYAEEAGMAMKVVKFAEWFKLPGLYLEAVLNLDKGVMILFSEDSEARTAALTGDYAEGWLQESKGLVLIASGAPAAATLLTGAGVAAAEVFPVLIIPLAVAALFDFGVFVHHYIKYGPENFTDNIRDALIKARRLEFGDFLDKERTADSLTHFSNNIELFIAANMRLASS